MSTSKHIYTTFETERLILNATSTGDAPFIYELLNTPKWLQYIGNRKVYSVEDAKAYIEKMMLPQLNKLGFGNYSVVLKSNNTKIGTCGLFDRAGLDGIDLGFAFLPAYEKQGYAFEAATRLIKFALDDLKFTRVNAITMTRNFSSQKLLQRLGFKQQGNIILPEDPEELFLYSLKK